MTFEMSLFFWNFSVMFIVICYCLISISLALAVLTYVSHANKALKLKLQAHTVGMQAHKQDCVQVHDITHNSSF